MSWDGPEVAGLKRWGSEGVLGWFDRQVEGREPEDVAEEHARYIRAAGLDKAVEAVCGPFGLRRFMLRFGLDGDRIAVTSVEGVPLAWGGGVPRIDPKGQTLARLERALASLHRNMSTGPSWTTGALGVLRDVDGLLQIFPLFDDDADQAAVETLDVPGPPGHPLEAPEYRQLLAAWDQRMVAIQARTSQVPQDWTEWEVDDEAEQVLLFYGEAGEPGTKTRRLRCRPLGTFQSKKNLYTWQVSDPLFEDDVFTWPEFTADWDASMELGVLCCARLDASWLFAQTFDEAGGLLLAAVWE